MFQFISLQGAQSNSRASASLLLLENGIKILVDCGWSEPFDIADLADIEKHTPTISLILLTHPTIAHIGSYAHCCAHIPLFSRIPVYCTYPVANLGRSLLQDVYLSTPQIATTLPPLSPDSPNVLLSPPTSEDIDRYFDAFNSLKYSQSYSFSAPLTGLTITAHRAGHTLGGTIWRIQHLQENILYAVDWNHSRDAHLSSAALLPSSTGISEEFIKPTAMICSTRNAIPTTLTAPRKKRDDLLLSAVRKAAFSGGTVLIPTDSSARLLELAYLLEHDYRNKASGWHGSNASINLAVHTAGRTFRYVRALLEWMDESMVKEFESTGTGPERSKGKGRRDENQPDRAIGPFDFRHLKLMEHKRHVTKLLSNMGGKVILTSDKSLDWGFSIDVIQAIAEGEKSLIVLTERAESKFTHSSVLYEAWKTSTAKNMGDIYQLSNLHLDLNIPTKVPLTPDELVKHQEYILSQQVGLSNPLPGQSQTADAQIAPLDDDPDVSSSSDSDESEDEDSTKQGKSLISSAANPLRKLLTGGAEDSGINILLKNKNVHDYDVRNAKGRNRMFPYNPPRRKVDEYGEIIRAEDFIRAEEHELLTTTTSTGEKLEFFGGAAGTGGVATTEVGRKRKWDRVTPTDTPALSRRNSRISKRQRRGRSRSRSRSSGSGVDSDEEESEDDYEPGEVSSGAVCKLVNNVTTITLNTNITYIDYEAIHDARSLRMLLPLLKPKKLILVAGSAEETSSLANDVRSSMDKEGKGEVEVYTPKIGEVVNASVDTDAWTVKLSEELSKVLKWQNVRGLGVVHVVGRVTEVPLPGAEVAVKDEMKMEVDGEANGQPTPEIRVEKQLMLDTLPAAFLASVRTSAQPIHVGDVRLADLRKVLLDAGHSAELTGEGRLLCDGVVSVVKEGVGRVSIEDIAGGGGLLGVRRGTKSKFWEVRRRVYEGLASVVGA